VALKTADMHLPIKKHGKFTILSAGKDLSLCSDEHRMIDALALLVEDNQVRYLCVDLSRAAVIDSSVIGAIVECHKRIAADGGELVILSARNLVLEALIRTQIDRVIRFVENEAQL